MSMEVQSVTPQVALRDLADRLERAHRALVLQVRDAERGGWVVDKHRLTGKAQGVRLAASYVEEYLR